MGINRSCPFFSRIPRHYPGADWAVRETTTVIDDGCWKQVWAEMTDSELGDRLFTYLWSRSTPRTRTPAGWPNSWRKRNGAARLGW